MAYIPSKSNRFYAGIESVAGTPQPISADSRFVADRLSAIQHTEISKRRDKTGFRTQSSFVPGSVRKTTWELHSHLTAWTASALPNISPLFEGALGGPVKLVNGLSVQSADGSGRTRTTQEHGLDIGDAIASGNEIRFVSAVQDSLTFDLNIPFSNLPPAGAELQRTANFRVGLKLPSVSLYDYWDPANFSRIIVGAFVDQLEIEVANGSHNFFFRGLAADLLTVGSMSSYPQEPAVTGLSGAAVPSQLGALWMGVCGMEAQSVIEASIKIANNLEARPLQFGLPLLTGVAPGIRDGELSFTTYANDAAIAENLYTSGRDQISTSVMLQLGSQAGQRLALYMPSFVPDIPTYDDSGTRLAWHIRGQIPKGITCDELYLAFA